MINKIFRIGRSIIPLRIPLRSFSSNLLSSTEALSKELKQKIELEEEVYKSKPPGESDDYFKQQGWKISSSTDSFMVELNKQIEKTNVKIYFSSSVKHYKVQNQEAEEDKSKQENSDDKNEETDEDFNEKDEDEDNDNDDDDSEGLSFTIFLDKNNGKKFMIDAWTNRGIIEVSLVSVLDNANAERYFEYSDNSLLDNKQLGIGFETLSERVQEKILAYLNTLGFDMHFLMELEQKACDFEDELYISWLKKPI